MLTASDPVGMLRSLVHNLESIKNLAANAPPSQAPEPAGEHRPDDQQDVCERGPGAADLAALAVGERERHRPRRWLLPSRRRASAVPTSRAAASRSPRTSRR